MDLQTGATVETGRSERRRQAIIQAATEVFLRHGYLGATTDEVAARASVSKQTLYKHFADKQHLFAEIILDTTAQVVDGLSDAVTSTLQDAQDARKALRDLAGGFLRGLLQPDVVRLRRLVIAEADRFPEVGRAWFDRGFDRTLVDQKLQTAGELYQFMVNGFRDVRGFVLELLVIIILIIELVPIFQRK